MTIHRLSCTKCKTKNGPFCRTARYQSEKLGATVQNYWCSSCNAEKTKNYYHKNKEMFREMVYRSIKKYPHKQKARSLLNYKVRSGQIDKPSICPLCGDTERRIEAHHSDYNKPFEVEWMCSACHQQHDRILRANVVQ